MRVYSWNLFFDNQETERALDFLETSGADIFCLQEIPEAFLKRLKTSSWQLASAPETGRIFEGARVTNYGVILSRYPLHAGSIPLAYRESSLPLRGKVFRALMFWLGLWAKGVGNRHAVYADIDLPTGQVRVLNLHLPLLNPTWRAEEFELALKQARTDIPLIVCGDFNIVESPRVSLLNWLLGGTLSDTFLWNRERRAIEKRFAEHGLKNPLRGQSTHPLSNSQLDHILVPIDMTVQKAAVIEDRFGSDHCPISVSVA